MTQDTTVIEALLRELTAPSAPPSPFDAAERLSPLAIGLQWDLPVLASDARLFRVTNWCGKPVRTSDVGAPPSQGVKIGRVNDHNQSVLYVADSPDTAFAEARASTGTFSVAEWRTQPPKMALANGGIPHALLESRFPRDFGSPGTSVGGRIDEQVLGLFQQIFTLRVESDEALYRWSIACGLACGFAHRCERTAVQQVDGFTEWHGRYPFAGIAFASTRADREAINFAFNDFGQTLLRLENVQWVERHTDGSFSGLDFASSWDGSGAIEWKGRPAHLQIPAGGSARVVKLAETIWSYETTDGSVPHFA
jgi:RES domain